MNIENIVFGLLVVSIGFYSLDTYVFNRPHQVNPVNIAQAGRLKLGYKNYVLDYQDKMYCIRPDGLVVPLQ